MALVSLGSQRGDQPKTPTLRQYFKQHGKCPNQSHVKTIFLPNKLPYYTLITDHSFKVVVMEDNPMHGVITDCIEQWSSDGAKLVVVVMDGEKGVWELSMDTDGNSDWEEMSWGYRLEVSKPTAKSRKVTKLTHDKTAS